MQAFWAELVKQDKSNVSLLQPKAKSPTNPPKVSQKLAQKSMARHQTPP